MAKARVKRGQVELVFRTHGGRRSGAGRKPRGPRAGASHRARPAHDARHPVHVTMRVVGSAAGLRCKDMYLAIREATIASARREGFRIVQMSIQRDHLHLIVEAESKAALSSGVRGFAISAARQINKAYTERGGATAHGPSLRRPVPRAAADQPARRPQRARVYAFELAETRRGSGAVRADVEGRSLLQWRAIRRVAGARGLAGVLAVAADVPAADRPAAAHLAASELGPVSPAHLQSEKCQGSH